MYFYLLHRQDKGAIMDTLLQSLPGFLQIVNIVVLLSALFFFTSTLASHLVEAFAGLLNSRGRQLLARLESALGKADAQKIFTDPLIRSISTVKWKSNHAAIDAPVDKLRPPSYIEPELFARVFRKLAEGDLRENPVIKDITTAGGGVAAQVEAKSIEWFKSINDHQNGVYTRWTFLRLIAVGLLFASLMDIDTLRIAGTLWNNPEQAEKAAKALQDAAALSGKDLGQLTPEEKKKLQDSVAAAVQELRKIDPPNYAWQKPPPLPSSWFPHWFLTALATSLGAQFWFNIMSEALKLRATGKKPDDGTEKTDKKKSKDQDKDKNKDKE
jgi:hypothetical protein